MPESAPHPDRVHANGAAPTALVHLAAGVGNIVLATPLLVALGRLGFTVDLVLDADYPETADLLRDWSLLRRVITHRVRAGPLPSAAAAWRAYDCVIPAAPPFYWARFASMFRGVAAALPRPPDSLFYDDEQAYYLSFARRLGFPPGERPCPCLPVSGDLVLSEFCVTGRTVVLAPGCKSGNMTAKRWPHFDLYASRLADVVVVGTADDLFRADGVPFKWPPHARVLAGTLTLRQTASVLAAAGVVVGNDSGVSHVAAALGTPTVMLFGPTPHRTLGPLPPNVTVLRTGLPCEPCWFANPLAACHGSVECLKQLSVDAVEAEVNRLMIPA